MATRLVGIAKAASTAPTLEAKRAVTYRLLATGKWINRVVDSRYSFDWSINPYRGCEMACQYCYARYTHEFMELREPEDFETRIFAKTWDKSAFRQELAKVPKSQAIAIGTATDPYQHAERRYRLTERILEEFARDSGRKIWITTKSDLPLRDLTLLQQVARRNVLYLNMTVTTLDDELARALEPRAPRPILRLETVRELTAGGIRCGVMASPVLPALNDAEADLDRLGAAAKAHGAEWFGGGPLFLKSPTREVFFRFLGETRPELLNHYERLFAGGSRLERALQTEIEQRFDAIRLRHGLSRRATPYLPPDWEQGNQMSLGF
jgi:DNA repair photolyase